jgi:hypothetical protein
VGATKVFRYVRRRAKRTQRKPKENQNKVDASRRAEKCRSSRVKVSRGRCVGVCLVHHTPFCPILLCAPGSLPPQIPIRPRLPTAPASRPPHAPFRPRLASAPASRPPHAPFRPSLPCVHARVCWVSANFHRQKPSVAARCVSAGLHRCEVHAQLCDGSQTHRLPSCRVARRCAGPRQRNSERPTAGARANSLSS